MTTRSRISLIVASAFCLSGCIQTLAPVVVPDPANATTDATRGVAAGSHPGAVTPTVADAALSSSLAATAADATLVSHDLIVPVAGAAADELQDSFNAPREGGRLHHAIDIMAPRGTAVLSADDGRVLRLSSNTLGGITVYTVDPTGQFVYYYAHLEGYRPGLVAGDLVSKGDTLGYVGTTGDAPDNLPHLHFQILRMPPDGKYWDGEAIDPYPLLSGRGTRIVGH